MRRRILLAFERAEAESEAAERARLLTFVVVGGGPTGVEMAGAIAELAKRALAADFRNIDPRSARVILVEGGPRLLSALHPSLSEKALRSLEKLGVEVRLNATVTSCSDTDVSIGSERIETRTIMWAAGVKASPAAVWLGVGADRAGRVKVEPDLSVPGHPDIFVLGDTALAADASGKPLPGVAPVAKQQGQYLAKHLIARMRGDSAARLPLSRFRVARHHRPQICGRRFRQSPALGLHSLGAVECRACLLPDRVSPSRHRRTALGLELRYVPARYAADYRPDGLAHARGWSERRKRDADTRRGVRGFYPMQLRIRMSG